MKGERVILEEAETGEERGREGGRGQRLCEPGKEMRASGHLRRCLRVNSLVG